MNLKPQFWSDFQIISLKTVEISDHGMLMRFHQGGSSSGGENVDCSGLDLVHLDDIITDMRIGNFIRVRTNGQPRNIKLSDITGMNLADNKLTDGDNLKEFLSYLPRNGSHVVYLVDNLSWIDLSGVKYGA